MLQYLSESAGTRRVFGAGLQHDGYSRLAGTCHWSLVIGRRLRGFTRASRERNLKIDGTMFGREGREMQASRESIVPRLFHESAATGTRWDHEDLDLRATAIVT